VDALHDAPDFDIEPAAHLLAALAPEYPRGSTFLAVVDPGVGGKRDAIALRADGRTFVGPDNGLLSVIWQRSRARKCFRIAWRPKRLRNSFHGRDLFAPVAAALATHVPRGWLAAKRSPGVAVDPGDLAQVIYIDHYGNCMTGLVAQRLSREKRLLIGKRSLRYSRTFEDARGAFWFENSLGLVEIAVPRGSAARTLGLRIGYPISTAR
jgi:S-adenosylmethionine hydrolase